MELQVHVVEHVGGAEQHRRRVGHVLTDALLEGVPRALPRKGHRGQVRSPHVTAHVLRYKPDKATGQVRSGNVTEKWSALAHVRASRHIHGKYDN